MKQVDRFVDWCARLEWYDLKPFALAALAIIVFVVTHWLLSSNSGLAPVGSVPGLEKVLP